MPTLMVEAYYNHSVAANETRSAREASGIQERFLWHPFDFAGALEVNTQESVFTTPPAQFTEDEDDHLPTILDDNVCAAKDLLQCYCIFDSFLSN